MNIRHLATKGFDDGVEASRSIVYDGVPIVLRLDTKNYEESVISYSKSSENSVGVLQSIQKGKDDLKTSPLSSIVFRGNDLLPISQLFDFKVEEGSELASVLPVGASFNSIFMADDVQDYMRSLASSMFPNKDVVTGEDDIDSSAFYAPYVPLVTLTGCIPAQSSEGEAYFNPNGVVTVAEFLDGLNAIKYGSSHNNSRSKSLDNISDTSDYFNEGYKSCLGGISSPFFNLYTRSELMEPITRIELAYITVICWQQFIEKYNSLYGSAFYLGVNFDWLSPADVLSRYKDGFSYKVSRVSVDKEHNVTSLNIKDYKSGRSMSRYKEDLKNGVSAVPLPMLMSLVELGLIGVFNFEGRLDPLREVSRGEFCYFLTKLSGIFPTMYIK